MENNNLTTINIDDSIYETGLTKKYQMRKPYTPKNPNHIYALIPGTILEIFVKKGDIVKKGDCLLIFEAMKMKNKVLSPYNSKIIAINNKVGDKVSNHQIIIELEKI